MNNEILKTLDSYLHKNDYETAENYLKETLEKALNENHRKTVLLILNELMGLSRKINKKEQALHYVDMAINHIKSMGIELNIGAATTYLNCATVYKAFSMPENASPLFLKAKEIYEKELSPADERLAGLYNNMGLNLVDLKEFDKAYELYQKALSVLQNIKGKEPEQAITYLNMASLVEARSGLVDGEKEIFKFLDEAIKLLDLSYSETDGNYAFVCEKCASVFGYYGYFFYENDLKTRSRRIYERS